MRHENKFLQTMLHWEFANFRTVEALSKEIFASWE